MNEICIKGTGSGLPDEVLSNEYFEKIVDTSDEWIITRTGIRERRRAAPGQALSDLALVASKQALDMAGLKATDLDLIIIGTCTGDMSTPSTACMLQEKLGAVNAVGFDVNAACPAFIFSLNVAQKFTQDGSYKYVLVVGGEILTHRVDYADRATCVLFGDGAGAVVLGPVNGSGQGRILSSHIRSDGRLWELLLMPGGGSRIPMSHEMLDQRLHCLRMKGNEVFKHAVRMMEEVAVQALETNGIKPKEVDWLIPHQANLRIMNTVAKRLGIPREKVIVTINKYGNMSAATIPVALDEGIREGRIQKDQLILINSFGAGFTWGSALFFL